MLKKFSRFTASLFTASMFCFLLSPVASAVTNNGDVPIYQASPRPAVQNCKKTNADVKQNITYIQQNSTCTNQNSTYTKQNNTCIKQNSTCVKQNSTCTNQNSTCTNQNSACTNQNSTCVKQVQTNKPAQNTSNTQKDNNTAPANSSYAAEVVRLVNEERAKQGLSALTMDNTLSAAAQVRAQESSVKFSHTRPNGNSCFTVLKEYGISYKRAGENIALGQNSPAQVVKAWMDSPGHRANILGDYTKIGVGALQVSGRGYAWSQFFIK